MVKPASKTGHIAKPVRTESAPVELDPLRLLKALDVDLSSLSAHNRAAMEALANEVLRLRDDQVALQAQIEQTELLADRDTLCPIFNRRAFERELHREIAIAARYGSPLCLVFIDLDRFKLINDRFGHATGDLVLKQVSELLVQSVRQTDIVGRLGGDEFGIALTHAELEDCQMKADALMALIDGMIVRDANDDGLKPVRLGASCGVINWQRGLDASTLISKADELMFRTKKARRAGR